MFLKFHTCCFYIFVELPEQDAKIMKIVGIDGWRGPALSCGCSFPSALFIIRKSKNAKI